MIEYRSRDGSEPTQHIGFHRWPNEVLTHGGAYAASINTALNRGPSGLNTDIFRPVPATIGEIY